MKKLLSLALICLTLITPITLAEPLETTPEPAIPPIAVEARHYTGTVKMHYDSNLEKGTAEVWVEKLVNTNLFRIKFAFCIKSDNIGVCGVSSWSSWFEGEDHNGNWKIDFKETYNYGKFNLHAVFGEKNGNMQIKSPYAVFKMTLKQ
ncbi:MAG: hypothetical protein GTN36_01970 [Candidatus Aenigmarchaeota archaeon]|nr:hypothetical protein [Candidatus Aenigmarchaeota archaeon]